MSATIMGTTISLTRGDTLMITLSLEDASGSAYSPQEGDAIRFKMANGYEAEALIEKQVDLSTMAFQVDPADTQALPFGDYVYDIQLTTADGVVDTVIPRGSFKLLEEVDAYA